MAIQDENQGKTIPEKTLDESPVILKAKTREELEQQFQDLKAQHEGKTLSAGAVAYSRENNTYILRIDIN